MVRLTILGSCRQDSLYNNYNVTSIKNNISYPHYTKEILQVIKWCLYNDISENDTLYTFRSGILNNNVIKWNTQIYNEFVNSDIFIIEIASRISYLYNNKYVHHILYDDPKYKRNNITVRDLTDAEIINDIQEIKEIISLIKKPIIVVGHIVTIKTGKRYELSRLLSNTCNELKIQFIDPVGEIEKKGHNILDLVNTNETHYNHYNDKGHRVISEIYEEYIKNVLS